MSAEEWQEELFSLYRKCREHSSWPKNFQSLLEWMDEDAKHFLNEVHSLYEAGAFK